MKEKSTKILSIISAYIVIWGAIALLDILTHNEFVGATIVLICAIIVWNDVKRVIGTGSALKYVLILFISAIIGQFIAPFVLGIKIANKIIWYSISMKIDNMGIDEIIKIESDLNPYIKDIEEENANLGDEFMRKRIKCAYGCETYADASALYNLALKQHRNLQK